MTDIACMENSTTPSGRMPYHQQQQQHQVVTNAATNERPHLFIQTDLPKHADVPHFFATHPHRWTKDDVRQWLECCIDEYALEGVQVDKFACMNGKALCMLTKQNFADRAKNVGDVLYNTLQKRLEDATSPGVTAYYTTGLLSSPQIHNPQHHHHHHQQRLIQASYDGSLTGVATSPTASSPLPDKYLQVHSPLVAASPPIFSAHYHHQGSPHQHHHPHHARAFSRQLSVPGRTFLSAHRPSSRSPSPHEAPINLTTNSSPSEASAEATLNGREATPNGVIETETSRRQSLKLPSRSSSRLTPSPPGGHHENSYFYSSPRFHRQISEGSIPTSYARHHSGHHPYSHHRSPQHYVTSPGSRSPGRGTRTSPTGSSRTPEPAHKVPRMSTSSHSTASPLTSPSYLSPPIIFPGGHSSPEGGSTSSSSSFKDLSKKLSYVRMDSREDTLHGYNDDMPPRGHPTHYYINQYGGHHSDPEMEESAATGSDVSVGGSESPESLLVEDQKLPTPSVLYTGSGGHVVQIGLPPAGHRHNTSSDESLQIPVTVNSAENGDDYYNPDKPDSEGSQGDSKLLWEFIYQLLRNPDYHALLRWEDESRYVFRIINPSKLAYLWGLQKSRDNMTYEKLSRALRYYYRMNIIVKEPHRRLTYRFVKPPEHIQRGQKGAKPGVAHKRRNSEQHQPINSNNNNQPNNNSNSHHNNMDVPRIAVSTPRSPLEVTSVIYRSVPEKELTENMFKQGVVFNGTINGNASVFPGLERALPPMSVHGGHLSPSGSVSLATAAAQDYTVTSGNAQAWIDSPASSTTSMMSSRSSESGHVAEGCVRGDGGDEKEASELLSAPIPLKGKHSETGSSPSRCEPNLVDERLLPEPVTVLEIKEEMEKDGPVASSVDGGRQDEFGDSEDSQSSAHSLRAVVTPEKTEATPCGEEKKQEGH